MEAESEIANSNPFFINRALECQQQKAKFPNFVTVDFVELGDSKLVVDQLNGIEPLSIAESDFVRQLRVSPNPTEGFVTVSSDEFSLDEVRVISLSGKDVTNQVYAKRIFPNTWKLNCDSLENGVYIIQCGLYSAKLAKE